MLICVWQGFSNCGMRTNIGNTTTAQCGAQVSSAFPICFLAVQLSVKRINHLDKKTMQIERRIMLLLSIYN
jgi:hypothetical protein